MATETDSFDVLRQHMKKEKLAIERFKTSPPPLPEAISRLKRFREYLEWSISLRLPATEAAMAGDSPMSERRARIYLRQVSRLIAHLECGEIEVGNDDVAYILFSRLPFESARV